MDSKLIQGLLLGSCVLLLFASLMTWAESTQYKGDISAVAASARQPATPAPAPAETAEPAEATDAAAEPAAEGDAAAAPEEAPAE